MRNTVHMSGKAAHSAGVLVTDIEFASVQEALRKGTRGARRAPKSFTGCVSEISSFAAPEHSYADALKDYAQVYEAYQAYLTPADTVVQHDYDSVGVATAAGHQLGCLNEELVECTVPVDDVSDEEIESCGYLGWVHHS
jgi:hypothetical protein